MNNEDKELNPSWYRREDESDLAYELFETYRLLPPSDRTYVNVARRRTDKGNDYSTIIRKHAKLYNWNDRVRDWDNHLTFLKDKQITDLLAEAKIEHQELARAVRVSLSTPLKSFAKKINNGENFDSMSMKELYKLLLQLPERLKRLQEIEFTALGHATEIKKQDVTSNGNTITVNLIDDL